MAKDLRTLGLAVRAAMTAALADGSLILPQGDATLSVNGVQRTYYRVLRITLCGISHDAVLTPENGSEHRPVRPEIRELGKQIAQLADRQKDPEDFHEFSIYIEVHAGPKVGDAHPIGDGRRDQPPSLHLEQDGERRADSPGIDLRGPR